MIKAQMKTLLKAACLALLLGLPLTGFLLSPHSQTMQTEWMGCPFSIRISTLADQVKIGQRIPINIVTTNTATQPCTYADFLSAAATLHYMIIVITDRVGDVPKTRQLINIEHDLFPIHGTETVTWGPGQTKSENMILNELYNISTPGTYLIRLAGGYQYSVLSNLIRVTVTQ
jgi:hypothetical protein